MTARYFVDSNAAARLSECDYLLTEDLQHGQDLDGLIVLGPFQIDPGAAR